MTVTTFNKPTPTLIGILFDGKNGKAVADFVKSFGHSARAGGSWIKLGVNDDRGSGWTQTIKKGTWVLVEHPTDRIVLMNEDIAKAQLRKRKALRYYQVNGEAVGYTAFGIKTPDTVEAIQLVKGAARDVAHFLRGTGRDVKVGGTWVKFDYFANTYTAKLGDWVVLDNQTGVISVYADDVFEGLFVRKTKR